MITVVARSANLSPYLKATTQVVASGLKPLAAGVPLHKETVVALPGTPLTSQSLGKLLVKGSVSVVSGPTGSFILLWSICFANCIIFYNFSKVVI